MKANELRIGNWVCTYASYGIVPELVKDFSERTINKTPIEHFGGIPLTEEWLVKFGFEKHKLFENNFQYNGNGLYPIFKGDEGWWLDDNESGTINDKPISYVHQLQNLYFALTGEELLDVVNS